MLPLNYIPLIERFAELAGLTLIEGQEAFELIQTLRLILQADAAGVEAMRNIDQVEAQIEQSRKMTNRVRAIVPSGGFDPISQQRAVQHTDDLGRKTILVSTSSDESVILHLVVILRRPKNFKLHIYPERLASRVGKFLFRLQDIQLGDATLDHLVMIKAEDVPGATELLTDAQVQSELRAVYAPKNYNPQPVCNDISVRVSVTPRVTPEELQWWHERLLALEAAL